MKRITRRKFIKTNTAAAAGLMALTAGTAGKTYAQGSGWPSVGVRQINPDIDNLRVTFCNDPAMLVGGSDADFGNWSVGDQNQSVVRDVVHANIDKMACALAREADPSSAWQKIFQLGAKDPADVVVAFKINAANYHNYPRWAVAEKVCMALVDVIGVQGNNINFFDNGGATGNRIFEAFDTTEARAYLPEGLQVSRDMGGTRPITLPNGETFNCVSRLADDEVDILINLGVNRGHASSYGGISFSLKNHTGTIKFNCPDNAERMFSENMTTAVLGDPGSGKPARQQLCFNDGLMAMYYNEGTGTDSYYITHHLFMGTFGPAMDYLIAKKFRQDVLGLDNVEDSVVDQFLPAFGYSEQERDDLLLLDPAENDGRGWVDAMAWTPTGAGRPVNSGKKSLRSVALHIRGGWLLKRGFMMTISPDEIIETASVYTLKGRLIARLKDIQQTKAATIFTWQPGNQIARGTYILRMKGNRNTYSKTFMLS